MFYLKNPDLNNFVKVRVIENMYVFYTHLTIDNNGWHMVETNIWQIFKIPNIWQTLAHFFCEA